MNPKLESDNNLFLVVEDDDDHAEIIMRGFSDGSPSTRVLRVENGEAALDYLFRRAAYADPAISPRPRTILLDLRLPGLDGIEVLKVIKTTPEFQDIPVIMLTSSLANRDVKNAYRNHANGYLVKQTEFSLVTEMVHALDAYWLKWNRPPLEGGGRSGTTECSAGPTETEAEQSHRLARILLIEDDAAHSAIIERSFERDGQFELCAVSSITEAEAELGRAVFELVIADWRLPDGDAFELLNAGRKFPLLIMTSHGDEMVAVRAIRAGALDYVVKSETSLLTLPRLARGAIKRWKDISAREIAEADLHVALLEKTVLLKEVHHRVKNNLAVVAGLLGMQAEAMKDEVAKRPLLESQRRVHTMASIHEHLYDTKNLSRVRFDEYADKLSGEIYYIFSSPPEVQLKVEAEPIELPIDKAIPCGLILNELLSNAFKYAFPEGRTGQVQVSFTETVKGSFCLGVRDDGVGVSETFDWRTSKSLGLKIVQILSKQLAGTIHMANDNGLAFTLTFPIE